MTDLARELLEDISCGDYIRIRYGTPTDQESVEGTVERIGEITIKLIKKDGHSFKLILDDNLKSVERLTAVSETKEQQRSLSSEQEQQAAPSASRKMVSLPAEKEYLFDYNKALKMLHRSIGVLTNVELKRSMNAVIDSFNAAQRTNELEYKYHNIRARIISLWEMCKNDEECMSLYELLGIVSIAAGKYRESVEPLVRACKYDLAAFSARQCQNSEAEYVLNVCAMLKGEKPVIDVETAGFCVKYRDVITVKNLLNQFKNQDEYCERIATCTQMMLQASGGKLRSEINAQLSAFEAAELFLQSIPVEWASEKSAWYRWSAFEQYRYRDQKAIDEKKENYTGTIFKFNEEQKWGFITPNHYFYIEQVRDDTRNGIELRKMLFVSLWRGLEVSFSIGESNVRPGQLAATSIELTDRGLKKAQKTAADYKPMSGQMEGFVDEFYPEYGTGIIYSNGKKYKFNLKAISDPWLRAYYHNCFSPKVQDVFFEATAKRAVNIQWRNAKKEDVDSYGEYVTEKEKENWALYQRDLNKTHEPAQFPKDDPYSNYPYVDLNQSDRIHEDRMPSMLTWDGSVLPPENIIISLRPNQNSQHRKLNNPSNANQSTSDGKYYAGLARKEMAKGQFETAEQNFENSLQEGYDEAVVCDYISLCTRQEGKADQAVALIEKYGHRIPRKKLINLKIQVYDKKKDYATLCGLYEEAFSTASSVSSKSHMLFRLIDAYIKVQDYQGALKTCNRWEKFYNQNRFSSEAERLSKVVPLINRQKAICLYHSGRIDEARTLATDLVRLNPADVAANRILDGTLGTEFDSSDDPHSSDSLYQDLLYDDDEVEEEGKSTLTRFVKDRIEQSNLAMSLKSSNLKDGSYVGSVKEADDDLRRLIKRGQGASSKVRSDSLFAACQLLEQLEQRADYQPKTAFKLRLAGRAMTSWGDLMVSQARQMDTPRMAYLFALRILKPNKRVNEQDWTNAYNRYLKSFFLAQKGTNSLEEYILDQTNRKDKDSANTDVLIGKRIQEVLFSEFFVGLLNMISAIESQEGRRNTFASDLFSKNEGIRLSIIKSIAFYTGKQEVINDVITFREKLIQCVNILKEKTDALHDRIVQVGSVFLSQRIPDDQIQSVNAEVWKPYLTATDQTRLSRINYILLRSQDYYASMDFENRADSLRAVIEQVEVLFKDISSEPTDISYDTFRPFLSRIRFKIVEEQTRLFQGFQPKLILEETIPPFRTPDGCIQIQLTIRNEANYQSADAIEIVSVTGEDIRYYKEGATEKIQTLRGGDEREIGLSVIVSDAANETGSFTATIQCSYKCSDSPQNVITKKQSIDFMFVVRDENFTPLVNPFHDYEGKPMDNEEMFIGRSSQIQQILDVINADVGDRLNYGHAIAMYGQTRAGKSSLMYHLRRKLETQYGDRIIVWDMGNIGDIGDISKDENFFVSFLIQMLNIGSEAIEENESLSEMVEEMGLTAPIWELQNAPQFAITSFLGYMRKLNQLLRERNQMIVLMLDEFTYLHSMRNTKTLGNFMRFWKALLQNYCIFAIVAGQDDMPEFMRSYPNEFACMELLKLTYLQEQDAKLLIRKPLETRNHRKNLFRDDGTMDTIYELTAGSAYLTIILCSKLVDFLNEKGAYVITRGILADYLRTRVFGPQSFLTEMYFEPQLRERGHTELDKINRGLLLSIARLSKTTGYARLRDIWAPGLSEGDMVQYVERLVDRNVLSKERGDQYSIQVKLLQKWLIHTMGE